MTGPEKTIISSRVASGTEKDFYSGNFKAVLERMEGKLADKDLPFVIGALCFSGRVFEAEVLFNDRGEGLSPEAKTAGRFFLATALIRGFHRRKALRYLRLNKKEGVSPFYIYQGFAIHRYYERQFASCEILVRKALESATKKKFVFGRALALDLTGHTQVQRGEIPKGLQALELAGAIARRLGNEGLWSALRSSLVLYRCQFGFAAEESLGELEKEVAQGRAQDNFTRSNLLLESVRQYTLRGQFARAEKMAQQALYLIYSAAPPRQEVIYYLRMAELSYQRGDDHQALSFLAGARRALKEQTDPALQQALLGLELKILEKMEFPEAQRKNVRAELLALSEKSFHAYNERILARTEKRGVVIRPGQDLVGDLIEELRSGGPGAVERICESGYPGLLLDHFSVTRGKSVLLVDALPRRLLLYSPQGVLIRPFKSNQILRKILVLLSQGLQSKKELVESVWGYRYEAYRHDTLVYAQMRQLRKILGPLSTNLVFESERGYELKLDIRFATQSEKAKTPPAVVRESAPLPLKADLNYRQMQFLQALRLGEFLSSREFAEKFKISEITAVRDLKELVRRGYLLKSGKARATRYTKAES